MTHGESGPLRAAWIGADGGAVLLGLNELWGPSSTTLLTDYLGADPAVYAGTAFLAAGAVGLAHKVGAIEE